MASYIIAMTDQKISKIPKQNQDNKTMVILIIVASIIIIRKAITLMKTATKTVIRIII